MGYLTITTEDAVNHLVDTCHSASYHAGWWHHQGANLRAEMNSGSRFGKAIAAEKLALIHSEGGEMLEGIRKGTMDEHLPHLTSEEVEAADMMIRLADYCGARGINLGRAVEEKLAYNRTRSDHKPEAREAAGGKAF